MNKQLSDRIYAFNTWCLGKILHIPYTRHVTNVEVRHVTSCSAASRLVCRQRLQLFDHLARRPDDEDHHRVLVAAMSNPPKGWRRPTEKLGREPFPKIFSPSTSASTQLGVLLQIVSSGMNWSTPLCFSRSTSMQSRKVVRQI